MEKTKFTPGPCDCKQDSTLTGFYIQTVNRTHNKTFIAEVGGGLQRMFEVGANARLIAAAPDLYEALQDLWAHYEAHGQILTWDVSKAKAALNKAS